MKRANISIFVPHIGCPNNCAFCNQFLITGVQKAPTENDVLSAVKTATQSKGFDSKNTEIAFFGGSFTAIDREYMLSLLKAAYIFVENKTVLGIRISTRPDAITPEILEILKSFGVTAIELGAQSMCDSVLSLNKRGHLSNDVKTASKLISSYGFELGLQMMTGLYGSSIETDLYTACEIIKLAPKTVRIYPTITLKETHLASLYKQGLYKPSSLEDTIKLCAKLLLMFEKENIKVIRLGLHTIDMKDYVAGPWHPAFGELCFSELFLEKFKLVLKEKGNYRILVNPVDLSKALGQKKRNLVLLKQLGFNCEIKTDEAIKRSEFSILRV